MNKLTIIGNLTRDPESRTTQDGKEVCNFTVACNRRQRRNQNNNDQPEADFFRVSAFNDLGKVCQQYLAKGRKVAVEGTIQNRSYDAQDGSKRWVTEIIADSVEALGGPQEKRDERPADAPNAAVEVDDNGFVEVDDDGLPF